MRYDRSRGYKQGFYTRLDESCGVPLDRANLSCLIPWSTGQYALIFRYRGYMEVSYMMGVAIPKDVCTLIIINLQDVVFGSIFSPLFKFVLLFFAAFY